MHLQNLAYLSVAAPNVDAAEIARILTQSRRNNPPRRITGHLALYGDLFLQVLEGPSAALDELLAILRTDPRHTQLHILFRAPLARRDFADWSMDYNAAEPGPHVEAVRHRLLTMRARGTAAVSQVMALVFDPRHGPEPTV